ncbi:adenylosuccinate lyase [Pseudonocardia sp. CNS-004]|nr:adenylosuccinate lyase [Pseudonocardia sp. CNS-004]
MAGPARGGSPAHLIDSRLLGSLFASAAVREIFSDRGMVRAWLDAEIAMVQAQAEVGMAPREAVADIRAGADLVERDFTELADEIERTAHPLVPVVRMLADVSGASGAYVHLGATTQDITDTGLVLQCKEGLAQVEGLLRGLIDVLADLAARYRDQPMVGRTHAQHALPITLGFKFAVLLAECERHLERLRDVRPRVLVGQLGGAVGSLASFDGRGIEVRDRMMAHLGLESPDVAWHTARDGFTELVCALSMLSATCGKIANEIRVLQRTEVAELEEPFTLGKVGSSTMPHKRNPMFAEFAVSNAILTRQSPAAMLAAMVQEHERDMSMWGVEWAVVPETFVLTAGLVERVTELLSGLVVHPEALHRNLHQLGDLLLSEAAMMMLAHTIGKREAHDVVYEAAMQSWETGRTLRETLLESEQVRRADMDHEALTAALVPEDYIGSCREMVDRVVERTARRVAAEAAHE